jgi:hypothetical protein
MRYHVSVTARNWSVDMRGSLGAVNKPSGPLRQDLASRKTVGELQTEAALTVDAFFRLVARLRTALSRPDLDQDLSRSIEADLEEGETLAGRYQPNPDLLALELQAVLALLAMVDGESDAVDGAHALARQAGRWARQLFS